MYRFEFELSYFTTLISFQII